MNKIKDNCIETEGASIALPKISEVIHKEGKWYVATCPELGVASQGSSRDEAHQMLVEAVTLWLKYASAAEIKRQITRGARVTPLELVQKPLRSARNEQPKPPKLAYA